MQGLNKNDWLFHVGMVGRNWNGSGTWLMEHDEIDIAHGVRGSLGGTFVKMVKRSRCARDKIRSISLSRSLQTGWLRMHTRLLLSLNKSQNNTWTNIIFTSGRQIFRTDWHIYIRCCRARQSTGESRIYHNSRISEGDYIQTITMQMDTAP